MKNSISPHAESLIDSNPHYDTNPIRTYCRSLVRRLVLSIDENPKATIIKGCLYIACYSTLAFYIKYTYESMNDPNFIQDHPFRRDLYKDIPAWSTHFFIALIVSFFRTIFNVVFPILIFSAISYIAYSIPTVICSILSEQIHSPNRNNEKNT